MGDQSGGATELSAIIQRIPGRQNQQAASEAERNQQHLLRFLQQLTDGWQMDHSLTQLQDQPASRWLAVPFRINDPAARQEQSGGSGPKFFSERFFLAPDIITTTTTDVVKGSCRRSLSASQVQASHAVISAVCGSLGGAVGSG